MAKLDLDVWKAVQEYRSYVENIVRATRTEKEQAEMLTLERFAVWFAQEWPKFLQVNPR